MDKARFIVSVSALHRVRVMASVKGSVRLS